MGGIFTEYNRMDKKDIAMINSGPRLLGLVLPRIANDLQWNLSLQTRSKGGEYDMLQSVNIICDRCYGLSPDAPMMTQLCWVEEEVTIPFLTNFSRVIRLVGKF